MQTTETSLPSEAEIELPPIHMYADYRPHKQGETPSDKLGEGLVLKEGDFLHAVAEIGMLEHSLTTDLLNHLVFVQKVFMKVIFMYCWQIYKKRNMVNKWFMVGYLPLNLYKFSFLIVLVGILGTEMGF